MSVDWRELLAKYMHHVGEQEGVTFVGRTLDTNKLFSDKEKVLLREIDQYSYKFDKEPYV